MKDFTKDVILITRHEDTSSNGFSSNKSNVTCVHFQDEWLYEWTVKVYISGLPNEYVFKHTEHDNYYNVVTIRPMIT